MPARPVVRALVAAATVAAALSGAACARYASPEPVPRPVPQAQVQGAGVARAQSRRELEARAAQLERDPRRRAEAALLRARLRDGDFEVGDAVVLSVVGVPQFSDTFPVRAGRILELPEVPPIALAGVLRSELPAHLRAQIGRYVINPTIDAHALVRVAVAGAVARPGFYEVRPDAPLSAALMHAGGLAREGDATKVSVRRAGRTVIPENTLRPYVAMGATLDDLNIRPGDELRIGERTRRNWLETARTLAYVVVVATGLWAGGRGIF